MKKIVIILMMSLILFSLMGCDDSSGGGGSQIPSSGGNPDPNATPAPVGGMTQVYGRVFLGDTISDPSGVTIILNNGSGTTYSVTTDSLGQYQIYNVNPGYYSVSIDFSEANIDPKLHPPPECEIGWVIDGLGSFYGFTPQNPNSYQNINGNIPNIPIGSNFNDSSNKESLWFYLSPAQNHQN